MRKKIELLMGIVIIAVALLTGKTLTTYVSSEVTKSEEVTIILDPGHGGGDPGKVGINKALEKNINLEIANRIKELLEKERVNVSMTREDDSSTEKRKIEDMKARVQYINKTKPQLVVSIHQNSYHEEEIKGAQTFYYTHSEEGEKIATMMQAALLSFDSDNTRKAKANDTYYLLKKTEVPTIIVECGFLSNMEEAQKLLTKEYQEKVAGAVCAGIMEYLGKE